ncbi:MAG: nucleotidyltransferase family protein [Methylocystis sp.]|nr:nucleotidyltransferase family protein [Methylocystis sp.]
MNAQQIVAVLRENEAALRARGVAHAALFGSHARGDARPDSDIDIMIEIAPGAVRDIYSYVGLKDFIEELFSGSVDVVNREFLKPYIRPTAEADAIHAF